MKISIGKKLLNHLKMISKSLEDKEDLTKWGQGYNKGYQSCVEDVEEFLEKEKT